MRHRTLVAVTAVVILVMLLPQVRTRIKSGAVVLEAFGADIPRPFAPETSPVAVTVGGVSGRLYDPGGGRGILLVPGAAPDGVEDVRVNNVALALARSGWTVFIPEMELYEERFVTEDLERIVKASEGLAERSGRQVTMMGFSFGGSFALIAATDPRLEGRVAGVATLGAYFDLVGVVQAITTGASLVGERHIAWDGLPVAREVLTTRVARLLSPDEQEGLEAALAGDRSPSELSTETRALYEMLTNDDPRRTPALVADLPERLKDIIERFSPSAVADRITVPVFAMHSVDDPIVPYGELIRLERALPEAEISTVGLFRHVDFNPRSFSDWRAVAPDLARVWTLATWLLSR